MDQLSDAAVVEREKENIQPLSSGRSFGKLVTSLKAAGPSMASHKQQLQVQRQRFEELLEQCNELDDPLQVYIDYIDWTHTNFPQGSNPESGLLNLLERCTSCFRDVLHYKNDPRYLRIWLEYTKYSDSPRDIFVYLSKKDIGSQLAMYYEHFATYLHSNGNWEDAEEVFKIGIENKACPLVRLQRNYENFKQLKQNHSGTNGSVPIATPLTLKRGNPVSQAESERVPTKKLKLHVYNDEDIQSKSIRDTLFTEPLLEQNELGPLSNRTKENKIKPKQWAGEVIKQHIPFSSLNQNQTKPKIEVYKDNLSSCTPEQYREVDPNGQVYTIIQVPGKNRERVNVNMELVYPSATEEYSLLEILAKSRSLASPQNPASKTIENNENRYNLEMTQHSFTIPINNEDNTIFNRPRSPTMTLYSKMASNDVMNMFNTAAQDINSDDEEEKNENLTTNNFSGFVTETIHMEQPNTYLEPEKTPPTEIEDNDHSSPFIERPLSEHESVTINAVDALFRENQLSNLTIPLEIYPGYHELSETEIGKLKKFKDLFISKRPIPNGSQSAMIDYCGNEIYCLRNQLGEGGFGVVFLVERGSVGDFRALKIESPSSKWEFYILNQIHRRLIGSKAKKFFVEPDSLHFFKDESYLFMEYCPQFTLLDLINHYKDSQSCMEEVLCIYFSLELVKAVEALHKIGILHCDLKADNCMIQFESLGENEQLQEKYDKEGQNGWSRKSIKIIDFGRAIDLSLFKGEAQFKSNWNTDEQDCPQMGENNPWSYEADYYGLAAIIHTLLFGTYIKIKKNLDGQILLDTPLKRYWQNELWSPLFNLLLNPYEDGCRKTPLISELQFQANKLENWLEVNSQSKNLKLILTDIERDVNIKRKKLEGSK